MVWSSILVHPFSFFDKIHSLLFFKENNRSIFLENSKFINKESKNNQTIFSFT